MNIYSPRRVFLTPDYALYNSYWAADKDVITGLITGIPMYMGGVSYSVKSAAFQATRHRKLNDVVHAKLTSNVGLNLTCENLTVSGAEGKSCPYALSSGIWRTHNSTGTLTYTCFVTHPFCTSVYRIFFNSNGIYHDEVTTFDVQYRRFRGQDTNPVTIIWIGGTILTNPTIVGGKYVYNLPKNADPALSPGYNELRNLLFGPCYEYASSIPVVLLPREESSRLNIVKNLVGIAESQYDLSSNIINPDNWKYSTHLYNSRCPEVVAERIPLPDISWSSFLLKERDEIFSDLPLLTGNTFQEYYTNIGIQRAMIDACNDVPTLNDDSIANISELATFIRELVLHHSIKIPRSLSDAWLAYRYEYGTSSMDAQDAISFVHRHMPSGFSRSIKTYGMDTIVINGIPTIFRCCLELQDKNMSTLDKIWNALYKYGLQPNFYVLWDLIPYSFVVDWFIPIGDALSASDAMHHITESYDIISKDFSISYDYMNTNSGYGTHCYSRWQNNSERFNPLYWFESSPKSNKTHIFRFFDGVSLILGRH